MSWCSWCAGRKDYHLVAHEMACAGRKDYQLVCWVHDPLAWLCLDVVQGPGWLGQVLRALGLVGFGFGLGLVGCGLAEKEGHAWCSFRAGLGGSCMGAASVG